MTVHKEGCPNEPANYRHISVLGCVNTLLEKVVVKRIHSFLSKYNILTPEQHESRFDKSTRTALVSLAPKINESLNYNNICIGFFLDIKKALDTVNHNILLEKLQNYEFEGIAK